MTERYNFTIDKDLGNVVWNEDNMECPLTESINESYVSAEGDSPTRYLSVLDCTNEMTLENLNISLNNPKLEVETVENYTSEALDPNEDGNDQVVVFSVEGSDELFGLQVVQDEEGNLQKYQFQFRRNDDGQLEAIPETITLVPMEGEEETEQNTQQNNVEIFVEEDNSNEHILPDNTEPEETEEIYDNIIDEVDVKPVLHLHSVKEEFYNNDEPPDEQFETEDIPDFVHNEIEYNDEMESVPTEETSMDSQGKEDTSLNNPGFEQIDVNPDLQSEVPTNIDETDHIMNDSDENDYQIVEGLHITGDVDDETIPEEQSKQINSNILKQALKANKDGPKLVKKDNKLYLYVVQHPEKENVDSLSMENLNLNRSKVNPRSILKSSHAMFQSKNEIDNNQSEVCRKVRCKDTMQAILFNNFINKTVIPQAPVRKNRLPRKQMIKPVERMDEEIVVQEMMVSSNGFVETSESFNKENLAVTEYVELTDSDDDYDPKRVNRKKKKHRRKRVEIISDDSDDQSIIELDESDEDQEENNKTTSDNNITEKRRRGRPPKKSTVESPAKKACIDSNEDQSKPEIPCPKCNKTFPSQNSLKTHLQHHNLQNSIKKALPEYKYKCDNCGTTFINSILLKKHMCSKLFNCTICKKKFNDLSTLNVHKRTHAKKQMLKDTIVAQVSPKANRLQTTMKKPNVHKCKNCGLLCTTIQLLNAHMKTHNFNCATCAKSFVSRLLLEKHVRESCVKNRRAQSSIGCKKTPTVKRKCGECSMQFDNLRELFKHEVSEHKVDVPDKASVVKETPKRYPEAKGVPPSAKLARAYAAINFDAL